MKIKALFIIIIFTTSNVLYAQNSNIDNETKKLFTLCKVWGFLKYYHPSVSQGNMDWDEVLKQKIQELSEASTKKEINDFYTLWIDELGEVEHCKNCGLNPENEYFTKNFNLNWIEDKSIFSEYLIEKLKFIEQNRNQKENKFAKYDSDSKTLVIQNEKDYGIFFPSKEHRLLELFRYWNLVEYFFPYKYKFSQNWDDVLSEMIPKIIEAKTTREYHLVLLEVVAKTNDSQADLKSDLNYSFFGYKQIPIEVQLAENKLIITDLLDEKLTKKEDLKVGDIILKVNGKTIEEKINQLSKYLPAANESTKKRKAKRYILRSNEKFLNILILRNNKEIAKKVNLYYRNQIDFKKQDSTSDSWKKLENNIGYVNMKLLDREEVDSMYSDLKDTKAIIFDIRNYPKGTAYSINEYLMPKRKIFSKHIYPDLSYPGYFIWNKGKYTGTKENENNYKGKIILLVNEETQAYGEYTAMMLLANDDVTVIGSETSGTYGNVNKFKIAGVETSLSRVGIFYPDETELQGEGIKIDIEVKPSLQGISFGKDEVLERALGFIEIGE